MISERFDVISAKITFVAQSKFSRLTHNQMCFHIRCTQSFEHTYAVNDAGGATDSYD